jgi:tRNA pseudouridine55 synthase
VVIHRIDLLGYEPPMVTLEVECGKGTYIRSLAHDIGRVLGTGAHLRGLVRTRVGAFSLEDSVTPDELRAAAESGVWDTWVRAPDAFLLEWHAAVLGHRHERMLRVGQPLHFPQIPPNRYPDALPCRAYNVHGDFLAVLRYSREDRLWRPEKVLAPEP